MGNQEAKTLAKRKNHSFDVGDFQNYRLQKIMPPLLSSQKNVGLSSNLKQSFDVENAQSASQQNFSLKNSQHELSPKQQNSKLQKLTKTNDELRKKLMQINKELSDKLEKKKMPTLIGSNPLRSAQKSGKQKLKGKFQSLTLKKELQNAYGQVLMYKKQIQVLKKNSSQENEIKLQQFQDQATNLDQLINDTQKSLESIRQIVNSQRLTIKGFQEELNGGDFVQIKKESTEFKERLKKIKEASRRKEKDQKMRHELLIQLERKLREVNEQYIPSLKKSSAEEAETKSRIVSQRTQKVKNKKPKQTMKNIEKQFRYLPSRLEIQEVQKQLQDQKTTHEQYHKRIDDEMKKRNDSREERTQVFEKLVSIDKTIESLLYKKQRYLQIIMGNIQIGSEGFDDANSLYDQKAFKQNETVSKGENLEGQVQFHDRKYIKNYEQVVDKLRIVSITVWTNDRGFVTAFQFFYTDGESFYAGAKSAELELAQKVSLELSEGDYLRNIMGTFNSKRKYLQFIVFESLKGKVLKVGKQSFKNSNFNIRMGRDQRPAIISGACIFDGTCWRINRLDFLIKSNL